MSIARRVLRRIPEALLLVAVIVTAYLLWRPGASTGGDSSTSSSGKMPVSGATPLFYFHEQDRELRPREALYQEPLDDMKVRCNLCPLKCVLKDGQSGTCRTRKNIDGVLQNIAFGRISVYYLEKPTLNLALTSLDSTFPVARIGGVGCTMQCGFCLVGDMIQKDPDQVSFEYVNPEELIALTREKGGDSITFTQNEPFVNFEYILEVSRLARQNGITTVLSTNGFVEEAPLRELLQYVDGVVVGLKGFSEETYKKYSNASLDPILRSLRVIKESGVDLELMYAMVPTVNDDLEDIRQMATWVKDNLGEYTPLHFIRYWPAYKLANLPPTPIADMEAAFQVAHDAGLKFVIPYVLGNYSPEVLESRTLSTMYCPYCGEPLVRAEGRADAVAFSRHYHEGKCDSCGHELPGMIRLMNSTQKRKP